MFTSDYLAAKRNSGAKLPAPLPADQLREQLIIAQDENHPRRAEAIETIVFHNWRLVEAYISRKGLREFDGVAQSVDDFYQICSEGLLTAIQKCDPERSHSFLAIVNLSILHEMNRSHQIGGGAVTIARQNVWQATRFIEATNNLSNAGVHLDYDSVAAEMTKVERRRKAGRLLEKTPDITRDEAVALAEREVKPFTPDKAASLWFLLPAGVTYLNPAADAETVGTPTVSLDTRPEDYVVRVDENRALDAVLETLPDDEQEAVRVLLTGGKPERWSKAKSGIARLAHPTRRRLLPESVLVMLGGAA